MSTELCALTHVTNILIPITKVFIMGICKPAENIHWPGGEPTKIVANVIAFEM